ncbi:MAG: matrixin family metalloprotease [Bryobacteraceae bacterium]
MHRLAKTFSCLIAIALLGGVAGAQPALRLRGFNPASSRPTVPVAAKTRTPGRSHYLVQFATEPGAAQMKALASRGATVLSYVPDDALSIVMRDGTILSGLGIQWMGQLQPSEKLSPELDGKLVAGQAPPVLVEFYSDVPESEARAIAIETGAAIHDNPDLLPHHLLIEGTVDQVRRLADWDEVSYIFPASTDLIRGLPVHGCAGALTTAGPVAQAVPLVGNGWDGPGLGSANLSYAFVYVTQQQPADSVESEIERAYAEWAKYVQVTFTQTSNPTGPQTLAVLFASGAHGDGYPFTGPTGVLAHTFYPYPLNPEPIAGDQHFNNDMSWKIGADVDVFSVALHETGHALGLGHSDSPGDVMYPYYHIVSGLGPGDIAAIQQQYAAAGSSSPATPTAAPLAVAIQAPLATTSASSIALNGSTSGGSGAVQVNWSTNQGASGVAQGTANWTVAAIPLSVGANVITVTASDANQDHASQSVTVTSQPPNAPADNPSPGSPPASPPVSPPVSPGTGGSAVPPSVTVLSPAMTTVATSASSIVVSGTAQDNVGVAQVTWVSSTGGSGTATGTNNWTTGPIALYVGTTTILIYVTDTAGNQAWRSIVVTRS